MGLDNSHAASDTPVSAATSPSTTTDKLQQDAGIYDQKSGHTIHRFGIDPDDYIFPRLHSVEAAPDDSARDAATKKLSDSMTISVMPEDRQTMQTLLTSITHGDEKGFADLVKNLSHNPEKLRQLIDQANHLMESNGCTTRLNITRDGKVLLSDTGSDTALLFDPATGKAYGKSIVQETDGSILMKPGTLTHLNIAKTFSDIGNKAVNETNTKAAEEVPPHYWQDGRIDLPGNSLDARGNWFQRNIGLTDQQRDQVEASLEDRMSKLIPEAERAVMVGMTSAIMHGDSKAFAAALKQYSGDPEKLKMLVDEVDKILEEKGCTTRIDVTDDGKVLVSDASSGTAVSFDPVRGTADVQAVEHNKDGSLLIQPGELVHPDPAAAFSNLGDCAATSIIAKDGTNVDRDRSQLPLYPNPDDGVIKRGFPPPIEGPNHLDIPPLNYDNGEDKVIK